MLLVNTRKEYNGDGEESLSRKITKEQVMSDIMDAMMLYQNKILAKQFWASREEQQVIQVKRRANMKGGD